MDSTFAPKLQLKSFYTYTNVLCAPNGMQCLCPIVQWDAGFQDTTIWHRTQLTYALVKCSRKASLTFLNITITLN